MTIEPGAADRLHLHLRARLLALMVETGDEFQAPPLPSLEEGILRVNIYWFANGTAWLTAYVPCTQDRESHYRRIELPSGFDPDRLRLAAEHLLAWRDDPGFVFPDYYHFLVSPSQRLR